MPNPAPTVTLRNDVEIPQIGLGTSGMSPADSLRAVNSAIEVGYRHFDTAQAYGNESAVGTAIARSGLPRNEVFVTTKLRNRSHGLANARLALDRSLRELGLEYVDLYVIHWPLPMENRYIETWHGLERALEQGKARAIGVSNFQVEHLDRVLSAGTVLPAVNQIELHPRFNQAHLRRYCADHGIIVESASPLARGRSLELPIVTGLARKYRMSAAQIVLRWHIQSGTVALPKSTTPRRMAENHDVFSFSLESRDMALLDGLRADGRINPDPRRLDSTWAPVEP